MAGLTSWIGMFGPASTVAATAPRIGVASATGSTGAGPAVHRVFTAPRSARPTTVRAVEEDEGFWGETEGGVGTYNLPSNPTADDVAAEAAWLSGVVRCWLDDDWTELACHREIGAECGRILAETRLAGATEIQDVLMALADGLQVGARGREGKGRGALSGASRFWADSGARKSGADERCYRRREC